MARHRFALCDHYFVWNCFFFSFITKYISIIEKKDKKNHFAPILLEDKTWAVSSWPSESFFANTQGHTRRCQAGSKTPRWAEIHLSNAFWPERVDGLKEEAQRGRHKEEREACFVSQTNRGYSIQEVAPGEGTRGINATTWLWLVRVHWPSESTLFSYIFPMMSKSSVLAGS